MLNHQLFGGQPVLSLIGGDLFINSDLIPAANTSSHVHVVQAIPVNASMVVVETNGGEYSKIDGAAPTMATAHVATVRSLRTSVPAGVHPGGTFTVTAPDGTVIQVPFYCSYTHPLFAPNWNYVLPP